MTDAGWVHLPKSDEHRAFVARLAIEFDAVARPPGGSDVDIRFHGEPTQPTEAAQLLVLGPDEPDAMIDAVGEGAAGYVPLSRAVDAIVAAAIDVSCGRAVVPDEMLGALLRQVVKSRRSKASHLERLNDLTPREREVFELAARGLDKFRIGVRLGVTAATARTHLANIMQKMSIRSRAELVATAASMGIDTTPEED